MLKRSIAERVAQLEAQVVELQAVVRSNGAGRKRGWEEAVEEFSGSEALQSIFAEAMKLREAERRRARRRRPRSRKVRK
ncbi:MAG: hypothetical protein HYS13_15770 [Planctomycetia bacterium]|nr:hypothetical protein [Planctomycetia bacterium]